MTPRTQELVLTLLGAIGFKIVISDTYLHYVNPWMKWPILAASTLLIVVSVRYLFLATEMAETHAMRVSMVTWLLLLPVLVLFVASPPELGAYAAERRVATNAPRPTSEPKANAGTGDSALNITLGDFVSFAEWEPARKVTAVRVALTGFVSKGPGGS